MPEREQIIKALRNTGIALASTFASIAQPVAAQEIISVADMTRGQSIKIGDKTIQLPEDTFVSGYILVNNCAPEDSPPKTFISCQGFIFPITRGRSEILVEQSTGVIIGSYTAEGEEGSLDFVRQALAAPQS